MPSAGAAVVERDDAADLEAGRRLFAQVCVFVAGIADLARLPPAGLPEVACAGRSNVGKSSLINALTGRNALARTSKTPGRTQQLNLFDLGGGRLILVDMPGYGYAQAPKNLVEAWNRLIRTYLRGRPTLRRTCLLVDARHGLKDNDVEALKRLDKAAVSYQIVLTKADRLKPAELEQTVAATTEALAKRPAAHPQIIATSAETGVGIDVLRAEIAALVN